MVVVVRLLLAMQQTSLRARLPLVRSEWLLTRIAFRRTFAMTCLKLVAVDRQVQVKWPNVNGFGVVWVRCLTIYEHLMGNSKPKFWFICKDSICFVGLTKYQLLTVYFMPVGWGCRICWVCLCRGVWFSWIWHKTIWWRGSSNSGAFGNMEYSFIAISSWHALSRNGIKC